MSKHLPKIDTKKLGNQGEEIADAFLQSKGYKILERNFRFLHGEIDIIARDGNTLVFVEVKTGRSLQFGSPETWVNRRKQEQIGRIAAAYLQQHQIVDVDCRFDVVAVTFTGGQRRIKHIENAFWL